MNNKIHEINFMLLAILLLMAITSKSKTFQELKITEKYDDIVIGAYDYPPGVFGCGKFT